MSKLKKITKLLGALTRDELMELTVIVDELRRVKEQEKEEEMASDTELIQTSIEQARSGEKVAKGYVEEKFIRGYGPYLYLRYWEGGTLKSVYLGKAKTAK